MSLVVAFSFAVLGVIAFLALTYFSVYFGFGLISKLRERL